MKYSNQPQLKVERREKIMKTRQHTRKRAKESQEMKMDKLSNLPDAIILLILSFLDTKYAVQTTVLSKRWNNLWTHLPVLNFNSESFPTIESLQRFMLKVFSLRNPSNNLSSLSLHYGLTMDYKSLKNGLTICDSSFLDMVIRFCCRPPVDKSFLDEVIMSAISHGVQQMDISLLDDKFCLTPCLFTSGSLKTLRLQNCQPYDNLHNSWGFASLTTLHLRKVSFWRENNCVDLFSSCVNLENLFLLECCVSFLGDFIISAPCLANLTIFEMDYNWLGKKCKVVVSAPRLTSFNYEGYYPLVLSRDQCPILDRVNICVCTSHTSRIRQELPDLSEEQVAKEYYSDWNDMIKGVSHAKQTKIDWDGFPIEE